MRCVARIMKRLITAMKCMTMENDQCLVIVNFGPESVNVNSSPLLSIASDGMVL